MTRRPPPVPWQASGTDAASRVGPVARRPGRVMVAAQVFFRSMLLAVLGGLAIGLVFGVVVVAWAGGGAIGLVAIAFMLMPVAGAAVGCILGTGAGLLLGALAPMVLVPARSARTARRLARVGAASSVAVFFGGLAVLYGNGRFWLIVGFVAVVAAAIFGPFLVGWYFTWLDDADAVDDR